MKKLGLVILFFCFGFLPAFTSEIQVAVPSANASWKIDTTKTIQWTFSGIDAAAKVRIVLWQGGTKIGIIANQIAIGAGGQGSFNWKVGSVLDAPQPAPGSGYSIKVRTVDDAASGQGGMFSMIAASSPGPQVSQVNAEYVPVKKPNLVQVNDVVVNALTILYPKAGKVLAPYGSWDLRWQCTGFTADLVSVSLRRAGQPDQVLIASTPNTGSYSWITEPDPPDPGPCRIAVETLDKQHRGVSGQFTVQCNGTIQIDYPKGGEVIPHGSTQVVTWKRSGNIQKVDIELHDSHGDVVQVLASQADAKLEAATVVFAPEQSTDQAPYKVYFVYANDSGVKKAWTNNIIVDKQ